MALQLLGGQSIQYPHDIGGLSVSPAFGSATFAATGAKVAMCGEVFLPGRGTKSIRKIHFRFGAVTKAGGSALTVSLQDINAASGSGPFPDETQDQTVAIANGDAGFTSNAWYATGNLSADRAVSHGDKLAVVWEFDGGGRLGADSVALSGIALTTTDAKATFPTTVVKSGGTWAATNLVTPNVVFEMSDGTFGSFVGQVFPASAINSHAYNSGTAGADEYAQKITLPIACKCDGAFVRVNAGATANFDIVLYDGTTAIASQSIDGNEVAGLPVRLLFVSWAEVSLSASTAYRLAVKPTTTNNLTVFSHDTSAAGHFVCMPGGTDVCYSTRVDAGSWADTATRRLIGFGLLLSSIHDGAGGSGGGSLINSQQLVRQGWIG